MVKTPIFKGSCTAITTPFNEHGIDYEQMKKNIEFQFEKYHINSIELIKLEDYLMAMHYANDNHISFELLKLKVLLVGNSHTNNTYQHLAINRTNKTYNML